ncbi:MAG: hypothetical protein UR26_C0003G0046 [candidate division TM6 bacterium GW2011_GWF2_32_72]|nr:MAG: hypothetical protein UR26_C0003G0046 [candidate division TM6 bacterium GW2011_GWF2_32_72]
MFALMAAISADNVDQFQKYNPQMATTGPNNISLFQAAKTYNADKIFIKLLYNQKNLSIDDLNEIKDSFKSAIQKNNSTLIIKILMWAAITSNLDNLMDPETYALIEKYNNQFDLNSQNK